MRQPPLTVEHVRVDYIEATEGRRVLNPAIVDALAFSIAANGLRTPLWVRYFDDRRSDRDTDDSFVLVTGGHRLAALKQLGEEKAPCFLVDDTMSDEDVELWEIDENLCRAELGPAETASNIARRKELYLILNPETAQHVAGGHAKHGSASDKLSFAENTAQVTGLDRRSIERDAARGKALGDELKNVAGTSLDKRVELDALAKLDPEQRSEIVRRAQAGEKVSARAGLGSDDFADRRSSKIDADVKGRAAQEVAEIIAEYVPADAWDGLKANLYAAGANAIANALTNITGQSVMDRRYGS